MADPNTVTTPDVTDTVNQQFFLPPQNGPANPVSYLDTFPDEVYNKALDSHLVKLMYAALGPSGVGWIHKNYLAARLLLEDFGVETVDLDKFYGDPIGFGRILEEMYEEDPSGTIPPDKWEEIKSKDAKYRGRAIDFVNGARAGNTLFGMHLVAKSGLGHEVEVVENYKYIYDQLSDDPIGVTNYGATNSTEEFVVFPRRELPVTETQTITVNDNPTSGYFSLIFPGSNNDVGVPILYNATAQNGVLTDDRAATTANASASVTGLPYTWGLVVGMTVSSIAPDTSIPVGTTILSIDSDTTLTLSANATGTSPNGLRFASAAWTGVKEALESIPEIGAGNIIAEGGPLPANPVRVTFTGDLGFKDVPQLIVNTDVSTVDVDITTDRNGLDTVNEIVRIGPRDERYLFGALDRIRPVASVVTLKKAQGLKTRQLWNSSLSTSASQEVVRYVTGDDDIIWPAISDEKSYWIENGIEHKAPRAFDGSKFHFIGFHNIENICSYTDWALDDADYLTDNWDSVKGNYKSEHTGQFTPYQVALFPILGSSSNDFVKHADHAPADYAEPIIVSSTTSDLNSPINLINDIYPTDYATLQGVPSLKYPQDQFWASLERTEGDEYLEIDLGSVKPVNYLYFETTRKPFNIEISFDLLDQAPSREWLPVTDVPGLSSVDSIGYDFTPLNPWFLVEYFFTNSLQKLVYTRFIRIKFSRRISPDSPFVTSDGENLPYSIEVKNLRIARNVSNES